MAPALQERTPVFPPGPVPPLNTPTARMESSHRILDRFPQDAYVLTLSPWGPVLFQASPHLMQGFESSCLGSRRTSKELLAFPPGLLTSGVGGLETKQVDVVI